MLERVRERGAPLRAASGTALVSHLDDAVRADDEHPGRAPAVHRDGRGVDRAHRPVLLGKLVRTRNGVPRAAASGDVVRADEDDSRADVDLPVAGRVRVECLCPGYGIPLSFCEKIISAY